MTWVDSPIALKALLDSLGVENQVEMCDICHEQKSITDFFSLHGKATIYPDGSWTFFGFNCVCKACNSKKTS